MLVTTEWVSAMGIGLVLAAPAAAQYGIANLTDANGGVTRIHRGAPAATTIGVSLIDGDQIGTGEGRAEITFHDGTLLHLDRNATVVIQAGERMRVLDGRVSLRTSSVKSYVAETASARMPVQPGSVVEITTNIDQRDAFLRVINGSARMENSFGSVSVPDYRTGRVSGPGSAPSVQRNAGAAVSQTDEFERWALSRLVSKTSIELRGTEAGGGVAYTPYYYPYSYGYYPYPTYSYPYYYSNYYSGSYPYSSSYYYEAPRHSPYFGGYYRRPYSSFGESYTWRLPTTPPAATPRPAPPANPFAPGPGGGTRIPKP